MAPDGDKNIHVDRIAQPFYSPTMLGHAKTRVIYFLGGMCCALVLLGLQKFAVGQTDKQPVGPSQILVLKNGEMLYGRVEQNTLQLIIHTVQGSRLVIPKTKADFVCSSLDEAFWQKSARTKASDDAAQVELFRWCLKHRLLDHAESQLNILLNCEISAAELASLNRQLAMMLTAHQQLLAKELAKAESQQNEPASLVARTAPFKSSAGWESPELKDRPSTKQINQGMIRQASFQQPARQRKAAQPPAGLSSIGAIPELKNRSRFEGRHAKSVDPYDPAVFNAETLRHEASAAAN